MPPLPLPLLRLLVNEFEGTIAIAQARRLISFFGALKGALSRHIEASRGSQGVKWLRNFRGLGMLALRGHLLRDRVCWWVADRLPYRIMFYAMVRGLDVAVRSTGKDISELDVMTAMGRVDPDVRHHLR